jgi:LmbE family N-acetylglucosaminyl deacetylase
LRILAVGAHPDDVEIGCGGSLVTATDLEHEIYIYIATRGEKSGNPQVREEEARKTADLIRAKKLVVGHFRDTMLRRDGDLIDSIESFINEVEPHIVFTHTQNDQHHDHQAIALASIEACRFVPNVLSYESPQAHKFQPQVFLDITSVISKKLKLLDIFWSQRGKLYLRKNAIVGLAEYRAFQTRVEQIKYAEAFEVNKICLSDGYSLFSMTPRLKPAPNFVRA